MRPFDYAQGDYLNHRRRRYRNCQLSITIKEMFMDHIYFTNSPAETEAVGAALASVLSPGSIIAYTGDLGAGKTAFTRGLAKGLGCTDRVTSPTYTIVNEYLSGRLPLFHFDMYRLASSDDLFDIGWEDYLQRGGVCAVEWSENVDDAMEDAIYVKIEKTGEETRKITVEGVEKLENTGL